MVTAKARDLMSVTELAKLLFVSKTYVRKKLLRRHRLRPVIVRRGRVRVSKKGRSVSAQAAKNCAQGAARAGAYFARFRAVRKHKDGQMSDFLAPPPAVPPPVATGGFILYLDFDGVLHPENVHLRPGRGPYIESPTGHKLFENVGLLEKVLLPYPDLRIVLSTSWVRVYKSVVRVARKLPPELRARVIGATYHEAMDVDLFRQAPRGMQVWADVLRRRPNDWLAIDDDYLHWPTWCREKLIRTHEVLGISAPVVLAELQAKLAAMYQRE